MLNCWYEIYNYLQFIWVIYLYSPSREIIVISEKTKLKKGKIIKVIMAKIFWP